MIAKINHKISIAVHAHIHTCTVYAHTYIHMTERSRPVARKGKLLFKEKTVLNKNLASNELLKRKTFLKTNLVSKELKVHRNNNKLWIPKGIPKGERNRKTNINQCIL